MYYESENTITLVEPGFGGAIFSRCMKYRYVLWRDIGGQLPQGRWETAAFVGLNPSTATHKENDPTIRRCIGYCERWSYKRFVMLNAFGYRATEPSDMIALGLKAANGPDNDAAIVQTVQNVGLVVAAWGVNIAKLPGRETELLGMIREHIHITCLGKTNGGHPKHPLYLRKDLTPVNMQGGTDGG